MKKILITTIVFNSNKITNECFIPSLYKYTDYTRFDLLIVTTSDSEFTLDKKFSHLTNILFENFNKKYNITTHALAIQKILDLYRNVYDDIIICENDTIIKQNLLNIINHNIQFAGENPNITNFHCHWWTQLSSKIKLGAQRYLPMLMYFNAKSFKNKQLIYEKNDNLIQFKIPSLDININLVNSIFSDPGWYFMLWTEKNNIKCKNINIDNYISHFWYGSENRNKCIDEYNKKLEIFKKENEKYLI